MGKELVKRDLVGQMIERDLTQDVKGVDPARYSELPSWYSLKWVYSSFNAEYDDMCIFIACGKIVVISAKQCKKKKIIFVIY